LSQSFVVGPVETGCLVNEALNHNVLDHADSSIVVTLITAVFVSNITKKSGHVAMPALHAAS